MGGLSQYFCVYLKLGRSITWKVNSDSLHPLVLSLMRLKKYFLPMCIKYLGIWLNSVANIIHYMQGYCGHSYE